MKQTSRRELGVQLNYVVFRREKYHYFQIKIDSSKFCVEIITLSYSFFIYVYIFIWILNF